ncbi:hypothetical protein H310_10596 [Aphanomyces invadans]|uniref:Uncharacterized protein n=1 Tax=Aphanomyces invadans TaxID=157072 RepID=A0A024TRK0_9STRA|nr:hypothetical protein H310_10596 [Aphanomyces invadans]ETV95937.1 hypothetical protein H310_10596 [Aphanomyces invadans]|eukprot:XP_008875248.1 hypothetical protein H310_10596 [Aphanomyces invadans]
MGVLKDSRVYFTLDWMKDYWQLQLHPDSQEYYAFMTPIASVSMEFTTMAALERDPDRDDQRALRPVHRAWTLLKTTEGREARRGASAISTTGTSPEATADEPNDVDMGQDDVVVRNAPALPKNPTFKGSTKEERRAFMAAYNLYISQTNALTANGVRP